MTDDDRAHESLVEDALDELRSRGTTDRGVYRAPTILIVVCAHAEHGRNAPEMGRVYRTGFGPLAITQTDGHWAVRVQEHEAPLLHRGSVALVGSKGPSRQIVMRCPKHGERPIPENLPALIADAEAARGSRRVAT